ncbi:MAG: Ribbon-helix-helix protein, copG family [Methanocella sp. PtaU1.Bin125]|nr:MAG: Ribbon-helix-helix protein, copG family [Methanocella sp. PtaU1.Bin125]
MKSPIRVTISFDEPTYRSFESLKEEMRVSQSELIRRAVRFYFDNRQSMGAVDREKVREYTDLLVDGEHVILDVDHWLLFLSTIDSPGESDKFWETHRAIARSHAEQLSGKIQTPVALLSRLEACNLFKLSQSGEHEFTLMTGPGAQRRFIRDFLEEAFAGMGFDASIKEDYSKLRVVINGNGTGGQR